MSSDKSGFDILGWITKGIDWLGDTIKSWTGTDIDKGGLLAKIMDWAMGDNNTGLRAWFHNKFKKGNELVAGLIESVVPDWIPPAPTAQPETKTAANKPQDAPQGGGDGNSPQTSAAVRTGGESAPEEKIFTVNVPGVNRQFSLSAAQPTPASGTANPLAPAAKPGAPGAQS